MRVKRETCAKPHPSTGSGCYVAIELITPRCTRAYHKGRGRFVYGRCAETDLYARDRDRTALSFLLRRLTFAARGVAPGEVEVVVGADARKDVFVGLHRASPTPCRSSHNPRPAFGGLQGVVFARQAPLQNVSPIAWARNQFAATRAQQTEINCPRQGPQRREIQQGR